MTIFDQIVYGIEIDQQTGCCHYRSPLDIIAIKFKCCQQYFACYECHHSLTDHKAAIWLTSEFGTKAILCGKCGYELVIEEYLDGNSHCCQCDAAFNPNCKFHYHYYFAL